MMGHTPHAEPLRMAPQGEAGALREAIVAHSESLVGTPKTPSANGTWSTPTTPAAVPTSIDTLRVNLARQCTLTEHSTPVFPLSANSTFAPSLPSPQTVAAHGNHMLNSPSGNTTFAMNNMGHLQHNDRLPSIIASPGMEMGNHNHIHNHNHNHNHNQNHSQNLRLGVYTAHSNQIGQQHQYQHMPHPYQNMPLSARPSTAMGATHVPLKGEGDSSSRYRRRSVIGLVSGKSPSMLHPNAGLPTSSSTTALSAAAGPASSMLYTPSTPSVSPGTHTPQHMFMRTPSTTVSTLSPYALAAPALPTMDLFDANGVPNTPYGFPSGLSPAGAGGAIKRPRRSSRSGTMGQRASQHQPALSIVTYSAAVASQDGQQQSMSALPSTTTANIGFVTHGQKQNVPAGNVPIADYNRGPESAGVITDSTRAFFYAAGSVHGNSNQGQQYTHAFNKHSPVNHALLNHHIQQQQHQHNQQQQVNKKQEQQLPAATTPSSIYSTSTATTPPTAADHGSGTTPTATSNPIHSVQHFNHQQLLHAPQKQHQGGSRRKSLPTLMPMGSASNNGSVPMSAVHMQNLKRQQAAIQQQIQLQQMHASQSQHLLHHRPMANISSVFRSANGSTTTASSVSSNAAIRQQIDQQQQQQQQQPMPKLDHPYTKVFIQLFTRYNVDKMPEFSKISVALYTLGAKERSENWAITSKILKEMRTVDRKPQIELTTATPPVGTIPSSQQQQQQQQKAAGQESGAHANGSPLPNGTQIHVNMSSNLTTPPIGRLHPALGSHLLSPPMTPMSDQQKRGSARRNGTDPSTTPNDHNGNGSDTESSGTSSVVEEGLEISTKALEIYVARVLHLSRLPEPILKHAFNLMRRYQDTIHKARSSREDAEDIMNEEGKSDEAPKTFKITGDPNFVAAKESQFAGVPDTFFLFICCLQLAMKVMCDNTYTSTSWMKVSGLPIKFFIGVEKKLLTALNWDV